MTTRSGRKWLRRLILTNQVTLQPSARDTGAQARALPNQGSAPLTLLTIGSDLEQWPLQHHQETPPPTSEKTN